ncbi:DUF3617 family protein [Rhodanobacter thiooxydans]|uniref:DUF3617 family protein n=2 Tax=Rhodanobacteraceae TaxID=1775411 RepID=UPI00256EFA1E|nr:DUF3617 family protein [Rhodanobacter thiooxydans]
MLKMSVTMKMQVPGAGDLPVRTTTLDVCISSSHDMRVILQRQRGCVVSDYRQVGHVVSYHLVCGGDPPRMTGDASFELLPDGGTNGSVHANGYIGGQGVVMDMTYAGQRTDSCDYAASRQRH